MPNDSDKQVRVNSNLKLILGFVLALVAVVGVLTLGGTLEISPNNLKLQSDGAGDSKPDGGTKNSIKAGDNSTNVIVGSGSNAAVR